MLNFNLKTNLILSTVFLISLSMLTLSLFSFKSTKEFAVELIKNDLEVQTKQQAELISTIIANSREFLHRSSQSMPEESAINPESTLTFINNLQEIGGSSFYMTAYNNGDIYSSTWGIDNVPEDYVAASRPWWKEAKNAFGKPEVTDVYADFDTGKIAVSIVSDFGDGVSIIDFNLNFLDSFTRDMSNDARKWLIVDNNGLVLSSTSTLIEDGEIVFDSYRARSLLDNVLGKSQYYQAYEVEGEEAFLFSNRIEISDSKNWYLVALVNQDIALQGIYTHERQLILIAFVVLTISIVFQYLNINRVYKPVISLKSILADLSSGNRDLTQRLEVKNGEDDLGKISNYINKWIENTQHMVANIITVADRLGKAIEDVSEKIDENKAILNEHSNQTDHVVTAIEEMSATSKAVAQHASNAAQLTQQANKIGDASASVVYENGKSMKSLVTNVTSSASGVQEMSDSSQGIVSVTEVIGGIAEQTNLLALNAAIEAARAGEQGRGFAVVADEVRSLASRTQESTSEIDQAVGELNNKSSRIVEDINSTVESCQLVADNTTRVAGSMNDIVLSLNEIMAANDQIATAAEEQNSVTQEISSNINQLAYLANILHVNIKANGYAMTEILSLNKELKDISDWIKI